MTAAAADADLAARPITRPTCHRSVHLLAAAREQSGQHSLHRAALPDPRPLTGRLAQAIAEVLAGARPASQLSGHATHHVIRQLERNAGRLSLRGGVVQRRPIIGSVHLAAPCEGVIEACAVIVTGSRMRALALRLEAVRGQWRCTAISIG
ncbi:MAG TPA: Rv3235 family protein [Mycobacteriales bacterium]|jgi:hypothetical protein|nr:Rv3235 family protein [Mycobacteriales bacterium]